MSQQKRKSNRNSHDKGEEIKSYYERQKSAEIKKCIYEISKLFNTGLSPDTIDVCMELLETGIHPQALAHVVTMVRQELSEEFNDDGEMEKSEGIVYDKNNDKKKALQQPSSSSQPPTNKK